MKELFCYGLLLWKAWIRIIKNEKWKVKNEGIVLLWTIVMEGLKSCIDFI